METTGKKETQKPVKEEKPVKKTEKFIWFGASAVIAVIGSVCRSAGMNLPVWFKIAFAAFILFLVVMAAQKTSAERFGYAGENGNKQKYILSSVLYYIFILIAVFYVFLAMWVGGVLSV